MMIVSWNILAQGLVNPKDFPGVKRRELHLNHRMSLIISELQRLQADVYLLQEVTPRVAKILGRMLPQWQVMPLSLHDQRSWGSARVPSYGNLTLVRRQPCLRVEKHNTYYWHASGTAYDVTMFRWHGIPITCFNIHLDSESPSLRMAEVKALKKYPSSTQTKRFIIGGDFNTEDKSLHKHFKRMYSSKSNTPTDLLDHIEADYIYSSWQSTPLKISVTQPSLYCGSDHIPVAIQCPRGSDKDTSACKMRLRSECW
jgi:endonuclease/exonuclease/phosphatase family metal-dependent hydrolase